MVAINSFSENLQTDINREAKTLVGADLIVQGGQPATDSLEQLFDVINAQDRSVTWSLVSMVYFPKNGGTRLSQVRALEGEFPFYGKLSTEPPTAFEDFKKATPAPSPVGSGQLEVGSQIALVEKTLMLQFDLKKGDTVRVGNTPFVIAGQLNSAPGRAGIAGSIAPVVYIPKQYLQETGLVQPGSLIWYQYFFKLKEGTNVADLKTTILEPALEKKPWEIETVEERREQLGGQLGNMNTFLNLVGFIALLLGCIGVASSVHIYIKDKMPSIAVLRCLGASGAQAFQIFLIQVVALGLAGGILGAVVGSLLQVLLPKVIGDFLPLENISADVSWRAMGIGILTGFWHHGAVRPAAAAGHPAGVAAAHPAGQLRGGHQRP
ncbi:MAG: FtsX-like permease family protein [Saprospiraceae bacterium]|nr:FtsX-like permease family protein [Saprospiraceae bacterium]